MLSSSRRVLQRTSSVPAQRRAFWSLPMPSALQPVRRKAPPSAFASYPSSAVSTLPNGVRVVTEELPGETATVQVWYDAGSRYESEKDNGVAHFLEHLKFKGTKQRSRRQLEIEIENLGAHLNAYTSREQTVYFTSAFRKDIPQAFSLLSDILQNSVMDPMAIENERDVILRELQEVNSVPEEVVFDRLHETAFRGQSLGRTILGSVENIKTIKREAIQKYIDTNYTADRVIIVGAGAVNHEELVKMSGDLFGNLPPAPETPVVVKPAVFTGSDIRERADKLKMAHYAIAFESACHDDKDTVALMFLQVLLGQWQRGQPGGLHNHSNLIASLSKSDCVEKVTPFNTQYSDTGLFGVYIESRPHDVNEAVYILTNEMTRLSYELTDEQTEIARHQVKANMLCNLDGTVNIADEVGRQVLVHGRRIHPSEMVARIDDIDTQAIKNCAKRFMNDQDVAVSAIGAIHELPDYTYIRRRTYWQRF